MPVTFVIRINVPNDLSIEQYKEKLEKRLEILKPDRISTFQFQTTVYQPNASKAFIINQCLHSDYPATCFSILESTQPNEPAKVLTGDIGLASIQRRISELGVLTERKSSNMECTGSSFKLGDFSIKIGAVTHSGSNRGLIVEISYACGNTNNDSFGIINEYIQSTLGLNISDRTVGSSGTSLLPKCVKSKPSAGVYFPEDTILQYFEHF